MLLKRSPFLFRGIINWAGVEVGLSIINRVEQYIKFPSVNCPDSGVGSCPNIDLFLRPAMPDVRALLGNCTRDQRFTAHLRRDARAESFHYLQVYAEGSAKKSMLNWELKLIFMRIEGFRYVSPVCLRSTRSEFF